MVGSQGPSDEELHCVFTVTKEVELMDTQFQTNLRVWGNMRNEESKPLLRYEKIPNLDGTVTFHVAIYKLQGYAFPTYLMNRLLKDIGLL